jgi:hypothetical protein
LHVCRFKKALYALKQASRALYSKIDGYFESMNFTKSEVEPNLYYIFVGIDLLILVSYVDKPFLTGTKKLIAGCKVDMVVDFEMKDFNMMHYLLCLEVSRN